MRNLKIDPVTGGFVKASGVLQFVTDAEAVGQAVRCELRTMLGEYFLDRSRGVPYVSGKTRNPFVLAAIIKKTILAVEGMRSVDTFHLNYDKAARKLSIAWTGTTVFGAPLADQQTF